MYNICIYIYYTQLCFLQLSPRCKQTLCFLKQSNIENRITVKQLKLKTHLLHHPLYVLLFQRRGSYICLYCLGSTLYCISSTCILEPHIANASFCKCCCCINTFVRNPFGIMHCIDLIQYDILQTCSSKQKLCSLFFSCRFTLGNCFCVIGKLLLSHLVIFQLLQYCFEAI